MLTVIIYSAHETSEGRSHNFPTNVDHPADRDHLLQSARASWDPQGLLWCPAASNPGLGPTAVCGRPLPEAGMVMIWHLPVVITTCVHRFSPFPSCKLSCFNLSFGGKSVWGPTQQKTFFSLTWTQQKIFSKQRKQRNLRTVRHKISDMWSVVKSVCFVTLWTRLCVCWIRYGNPFSWFTVDKKTKHQTTWNLTGFNGVLIFDPTCRRLSSQ